MSWEIEITVQVEIPDEDDHEKYNAMKYSEQSAVDTLVQSWVESMVTATYGDNETFNGILVEVDSVEVTQ